MKHFCAINLWAVLLLAPVAKTQIIPAFTGNNLAGEKVQLPSSVDGGKTVLVIGFSKKSGDACRPWFGEVAAQLKDKPQIAYYQLPVLAAAPGFIRSSIIHSIRNNLTPEQQKHFLPITDHEKEWKSAVIFSAPDDPYVVIVNEHGSVLWRDSGTWSPAKKQVLQAELAKL